jgi:hypothetical protein
LGMALYPYTLRSLLRYHSLPYRGLSSPSFWVSVCAWLWIIWYIHSQLHRFIFLFTFSPIRTGTYSL